MTTPATIRTCPTVAVPHNVVKAVAGATYSTDSPVLGPKSQPHVLSPATLQATSQSPRYGGGHGPYGGGVPDIPSANGADTLNGGRAPGRSVSVSGETMSRTGSGSR